MSGILSSKAIVFIAPGLWEHEVRNNPKKSIWTAVIFFFIDLQLTYELKSDRKKRGGRYHGSVYGYRDELRGVPGPG